MELTFIPASAWQNPLFPADLSTLQFRGQRQHEESVLKDLSIRDSNICEGISR